MNPIVRPSTRGPAAVLLTVAALVAGGAHAQADVPEDADALLERIFDHMRGGGMHAPLTLTVERPDRTTEYELDTISDGGGRALVQVLAPAREAGQAFLTVGDDLFVYTPRLGRVLRLPPSGRSDGFLGSDLSYADLAGDDVRDDYDAEVASRDDDAVELSLIPHERAPTPYGELRFRASLPDLAPQELTFLDQRGEEVKRIVFEDVRTLADGRHFPARMVVEDLTGDGGRTIAAYGDGDFAFEPPDRCFTRQALERGCL